MSERAAASPPAELDDAQIHRIIGGLAVAMFLAALDQTLVAVALLSIGRDLGDLDLMPWVIAAYLVAATISAPIFGKLSDQHGRWPMLAVALATGVGSLPRPLTSAPIPFKIDGVAKRVTPSRRIKAAKLRKLLSRRGSRIIARGTSSSSVRR